MATTDEFFNALRRPHAGVCMCWEVIPTGGGTTLRFTNHDKPVTVSGNTFTPSSSFSGSAVTGREGLSVDNLTIAALTSEDMTEEDLLAGVWDDAEIFVYLAHWDHPEYGLHILKRGWLGEVKTTGTAFETEVRGLAERLQRVLGKTYTIECGAQLGDARCKVDLTPFTHDANVVGVVDARVFKTDIPQPDRYFQYGTAQFLTGNNAGRKVEILGHQNRFDGNWITLLEKMPFPISRDDTVRLVRGCDKLFSTCRDDYNNVLNFRGFKDMPTEAEALETPIAR
jgi:uncharacterized phage protein (TIGR02218 family)